MEEQVKQAIELFEGGLNCAQAVLGVFASKYVKDTDAALRMAGGFGHGMRVGETCGAITGAVMVVGLREGTSDAGDQNAKARCGAMTLELVTTLRGALHTTNCHEILKSEELEARGSRTCPNCPRRACAAAIEAAVEALVERGY